MELAVHTVELTKKYGSFTAVDRLNLSIRKGEVFGLLGPNGAGKTTTILMLLGLTEPTSGKAEVLGHDPVKEPIAVKRMVGYLPENVDFYEDLTASENLFYMAGLNGISSKERDKKVPQVLDMVGLLGSKDSLVGTFSKGMRQRLGIAAVLLKDPKLVILDEPTNGIDPEGIEKILSLIRSLAKELDVTFLLCSHMLYQVQRVCDRVGIMYRSSLVASGTVEEVGRAILGERKRIIKFKPEDNTMPKLEDIKDLEGLSEVKVLGDHFVAHFDEGKLPLVMRGLLDRGFVPFEVSGKDYSLEEIYLRYFQGV
ncbi:ABC transporter related protein [Thermovirga lienii DSM 17291]|jgi:ABC-2 type transport system ATP-binding protein|uniref:ABC transporter related protein n=1 Tax=Thermovirga lienii (strain ATCC BAA-1197 / DSM 17291 / Cas60314) TaxID=580340 RepID=G7V7L3_THELD|nr:ABC transporter ATP-binding protein [Thermovirga lienii]AER66175.1 ABC transporter related protein [Thermovirga lienii DSM 17291]